MNVTVHHRKPSKTSSISDALNRHLSANSATASLTAYLDQGAELVTPAVITSLRQQQESLHKEDWRAGQLRAPPHPDRAARRGFR